MRTMARGLLAVTLLWGWAHLATNPANAARGGVFAERQGAEGAQDGEPDHDHAHEAQQRRPRIAATGADRAARGYFFFGMYRSVIVPS